MCLVVIKMYSNQMKNKDKPEFDFKNNNNFIEFYLINNDEFYGAYWGRFHYSHVDFEEVVYSPLEFVEESSKIIERFLKRKSKIHYKPNSNITRFPISLLNNETGMVDKLTLEANLINTDI